MPRYTFSTSLAFDPERFDFAEVDVDVSFDCSFGCAAQTYGPAERCYPAEHPWVDDIRLEAIGDRKAPWGLHFHSDAAFSEIVAERLMESCWEEMLEAAADQAADDHYATLERRWEDRREVA